MADSGGRNGDFVATGAQCRSERIVVSEAIGDAGEPADLGDNFALEPDRRAEAGMCKAETQADDDVREEMRVDAERGESGPHPCRSRAGVKAGNSTDAEL